MPNKLLTLATKSEVIVGLLGLNGKLLTAYVGLLR